MLAFLNLISVANQNNLNCNNMCLDGLNLLKYQEWEIFLGFKSITKDKQNNLIRIFTNLIN